VTDTKTAVNGLTSVMTGFGVKAEDTGQVADAFFAAIRLGKTTFPQLAANIGKVGSVAQSAGVSFQEVLAAMATMTLGGMSTEESATMLRGALVGLTKASPALQDELKALGFANGTAMLKSMSLQDALQLLQSRTDGTAEAMLKLFPGVEAARGVLALTGTQAGLAANVLGQVRNSAGEAGAAFGTMAQTGTMAMNQLTAASGAAFVQIGTALIPQVKELAGFMSQLASDPQRLEGLVEVFKGVGVAIELALKSLEKFFELAKKPTNFLSDQLAGLFMTDKVALNSPVKLKQNESPIGVLYDMTEKLVKIVDARLPAADGNKVSTSTAGLGAGGSF
jgi:TP901 family phage tail tape measure protein